MFSNRPLIIGCFVALTLAPACTTRGPSPAQFSMQRSTAPREALLESAELVLMDMGYQIADRDLTAGIVTTKPISLRAGGLKSGDAVISSTSPTRRVIEVRVESTPDGAHVYCKASVQEEVSQTAAQIMQNARSGDEGFGQTAIERDAATTAEQNTYWRIVSRDRTLEHTILEAIQQRGPQTTSPD